jgi:hypothetical protein
MKPIRRYLSLTGLALAIAGAPVAWGNSHEAVMQEHTAGAVIYAQYSDRPPWSPKTEKERCWDHPELCEKESGQKSVSSPSADCQRRMEAARGTPGWCKVAKECHPNMRLDICGDYD